MGRCEARTDENYCKVYGFGVVDQACEELCAIHDNPDEVKRRLTLNEAYGISDSPEEIHGRVMANLERDRLEAEQERAEKKQGAKDKNGKSEPALIPWESIDAISRTRRYGLNKYAEAEDWATVPAIDWLNAGLRHAHKMANDLNGVDEESGLPHSYHAATCFALLCAVLERGKNG